MRRLVYFFAVCLIALASGCTPQEQEMLHDAEHILGHTIDLTLTSTDANTLADYVDVGGDILELAEDAYEYEES